MGTDIDGTRKTTFEELAEAVRRYCYICQSGNVCSPTDCELYPYRMGAEEIRGWSEQPE